MKKVLALILALALVLSMAACGAKDDKIVINFVAAQYSDLTEGYLKAAIDAFTAKNPNVTVNLEVVGWDTIGQRITSMVGSKQAPDLYQGGSAAQYAADDLVYKAEDFISENLKNDFYSVFWTNNIDPDEGEVYQIPYVASVRALYYNKAIFDEVGIEAAPTTWSEVEAVCEQIKTFYNGEVYPWGVDATMTEGQTWVAYYGWTNGGGYVDEDYNYIVNCAENVEGLEWAYSLYQKGYTNVNPTIETRDDMQKLVASGKMAMLVTACFFPALYPDVELGIAAIPYNDANPNASTATLAVQDALLCFNENAKSEKDSPEKIQAIKDFLDVLYSPEYYVPFMIGEGLLPATVSGAEKLAVDDPEKAAYLDVLEGGKFYARNKQDWSDCSTGCQEVAQKVFSGQQSAKEALDELQAKLTGG